MAIHFWEAAADSYRTGPLNEQNRADFENSPFSLVCADPLMSYPLPNDQKPGGEPFSLDIQGTVRLVAPILIGKEFDSDGTLFWHIIPGALIFSMSDFSAPLETIEIIPEQPQMVGRYCDVSLNTHVLPSVGYSINQFSNLYGQYYRLGGGDGLATSARPALARCGWAEGCLYGLVRVGDWLVVECEAGNQIWGYNFQTETLWHQRGWDARARELSAIAEEYDPLHPIGYQLLGDEDEYEDEDDYSFGHTLDQTNTTYTVCGRLSPTTVLVYKTVADITSEIVSAIDRTILEFTVTRGAYDEWDGTQEPWLEPGAYVNVTHSFLGKWVNDTGRPAITESATVGGVNIYEPFTWNAAPTLQCGFLNGAPWASLIAVADSDGPHGPQDFYLFGSPSYAWGKMTADLDEVIATPEYRGLRVKNTLGSFEEWSFPESGSPVFLREIIPPNPGRVYDGSKIIQGPSIYTLEDDISYGDMGLTEMDAPWENYFEIGLSADFSSEYLQSNTTEFSRGEGLFLYQYQEVNTEGDPPGGALAPGAPHWRITSQDSNVCPHPFPGPWLSSSFEMPPDIPGTHKMLVRVASPIEAVQAVPKVSLYNSSNYVASADGTTMVFLPRSYVANFPYINYSTDQAANDAELIAVQLITCLKLVDGAWTWAFSLRSNDLVDPEIVDYFGTDRMSLQSGTCVSNGILTESFLFCVLYGGEGEQLFQICVNAYEDYVPGDIVATVNISGGHTFAYASASWLYDPLMIVNRRIVGTANDTHFWTLELESDQGSGS